MKKSFADRNQLSKLVATEMRYFDRQHSLSLLSGCTVVITVLAVLLSLFSYTANSLNSDNRVYLNCSIGLLVSLLVAYVLFKMINWGESPSYPIVMFFTAFNLFVSAFSGFLLARTIWMSELTKVNGYAAYFEYVLQWSFWLPLVALLVYLCVGFVRSRHSYTRGGWGYLFIIVSPLTILLFLTIGLRLNDNKDYTTHIAAASVAMYVSLMLVYVVRFIAKAIYYNLLGSMEFYEEPVVVRKVVRPDGQAVQWWERKPSAAYTVSNAPMVQPLPYNPAPSAWGQGQQKAVRKARHVPTPEELDPKPVLGAARRPVPKNQPGYKGGGFLAAFKEQANGETPAPKKKGLFARADRPLVVKLDAAELEAVPEEKLADTEQKALPEKKAQSAFVRKADADKKKSAVKIDRTELEEKETGKRKKKKIELDDLLPKAAGETLNTAEEDKEAKAEAAEAITDDAQQTETTAEVSAEAKEAKAETTEDAQQTETAAEVSAEAKEAKAETTEDASDDSRQTETDAESTAETRETATELSPETETEEQPEAVSAEEREQAAPDSEEQEISEPKENAEVLQEDEEIAEQASGQITEEQIAGEDAKTNEDKMETQEVLDTAEQEPADEQIPAAEISDKNAADDADETVSAEQQPADKVNEDKPSGQEETPPDKSKPAKKKVKKPSKSTKLSDVKAELKAKTKHAMSGRQKQSADTTEEIAAGEVQEDTKSE